MTISAYVLDKHTIKQTDFSNPIAIRKEMVQNTEESLWIHGDEPEDIFPLQTIFGLHPLSVEAVTHQNMMKGNKNNSKPLTTKMNMTNTTPTPTPTSDS